MPNLPYIWTFLIGLVSLFLAFFFPVWAWLPLLMRELFFAKLFRDLRQLRVKHIPELSAKANELLGKHAHYYWGPAPGTMYRQAASIAGVLGLLTGIVGVFKGSWLSLGIGIANLLAMMALAPRFDPSGYLTSEYAAAHDEVIAYVLRERRERFERSRRSDA